MSNEGMFSGLNDAPIGADRLYFTTGKYRLRIFELKQITAEKSFHGQAAFVASFVVEESSVPHLGPGTCPSWVIKLSGTKKQRSLASLKQFFSAVLQTENVEQAVAGLGTDLEGFAVYACSPANPLRDYKVDLVCTPKFYQRDDGTKGEITLHRFVKPGDLQI